MNAAEHTSITVQADLLKQELGENPPMAIRKIKDFVYQFSNDPECRKSAVMIFMEVNDLIELNKLGEVGNWSPEFKELMAKAEKVLDSAVSEMEKSSPGRASAENERVRKFVKHQLPPEMVVFRGNAMVKSYSKGSPAFQLGPLDLELEYGKIVGVVGENGNGKSTFLKIIAGAHYVTSGKITYPAFCGDKLNWAKIKSRIAYIPQRLSPWMGSVRENLLFSAAINGFRKEDAYKELNFILKRLALEKYADANWESLSGGFQMRFELARALIWKPSLLILDEPLANLDINAQLTFLRDLRFLANSFRHPLAVILSSQHLHKIEQISDQVIFLRDGDPIYNGATEDIGKNRTENIFEISGNFDAALLRSVLRELPVKQIRDKGQTIFVNTELSLTPSEVMDKVLAEGLTISFFRDISFSTRKYFETNF